MAQDLRRQGRLSAAAAVEQAVRRAEADDLLRQLGGERAAAEWRAREAILARLLPARRRLELLAPRDAVVQAAVAAMADGSYDALLAPPAEPAAGPARPGPAVAPGGKAGIVETRTERSTPPVGVGRADLGAAAAAARPVDEDVAGGGRCLIGQVV